MAKDGATEPEQRKPPPIVIRTVVPHDAPSPEAVLQKLLEEDQSELDRWQHTESKHSD